MRRSPMPPRKSPLRRSAAMPARDATIQKPSPRARNRARLIPRSVRDAVKERSGGQCEWSCDGALCVTEATHMHHRLRRSQGGKHTVANLLHLCAACHLYIHDHPAESFAEGWLLHAPAASVPMGDAEGKA